MEDGEINEYLAAQSMSHHRNSAYVYVPAYEWPGEPSSVTLDTAVGESFPAETSYKPRKKSKSTKPSFRLVVLRSSVLPVKQRLAIVDGYTEVQLGRDAPPGKGTPKVRLKELEVSKLHATVFWDSQRQEWSVVDMGSKHGTFLKSVVPEFHPVDDVGVRLSAPRVASMPKKLQHLDRLTLGSTTFLVHMHAKQIPCEDCSPVEDDEIPLFHSQKMFQTSAVKRSRDSAGLDEPSYALKLEKDPKKSLTMLKHSLLSRHNEQDSLSRSQSPTENAAQYVDRSARRRALFPSSHVDSPGVLPVPSLVTPPISRLASPATTPDTPGPSFEPVSKPATPLPSSNIGHRLLMKQGWTPGTALGMSAADMDGDRIGLVEPLQISPLAHRAGLGRREVNDGRTEIPLDASWKEKGLYRRWNNLGADHTTSGE
ncbi:hypothetical protein AMATHDRAFT_55439 [Amanita thiersii Skay4041]|uniref:G-patch domain-containing protein n=1 Tax=Amanita thiersii Skay4041 TaxID=703135 RepID=A0A2A9NR99_9AGAR|nr:hypothetical protein AMATHDRAFT_55439 [Amanita thiersii Skay4041]